jgi:hypothetical protein
MFQPQALIPLLQQFCGCSISISCSIGVPSSDTLVKVTTLSAEYCHWYKVVNEPAGTTENIEFLQNM